MAAYTLDTLIVEKLMEKEPSSSLMDLSIQATSKTTRPKQLNKDSASTTPSI